MASGQRFTPLTVSMSPASLLPRLQVKKDTATDTKCKGVILLLIQRLDKAPFDLKEMQRTQLNVICAVD